MGLTIDILRRKLALISCYFHQAEIRIHCRHRFRMVWKLLAAYLAARPRIKCKS